jgi:phage/conjugal plasmid C-4 type zinc finger TraR family protein
VTGSDKRQLEGLLQARSEDMRHGRRPRRGTLVTTAFVEASVTPDVVTPTNSSARCCETCGDEIGARRLRAMPRAALCLDCQRSAERAEIAT